MPLVLKKKSSLTQGYVCRITTPTPLPDYHVRVVPEQVGLLLKCLRGIAADEVESLYPQGVHQFFAIIFPFYIIMYLII